MVPFLWAWLLVLEKKVVRIFCKVYFVFLSYAGICTFLFGMLKRTFCFRPY